jgi:hypothetical protein
VGVKCGLKRGRSASQTSTSGCFVGVVVVEHQVDRLGGIAPVEDSQESEELLAPVPFVVPHTRRSARRTVPHTERSLRQVLGAVRRADYLTRYGSRANAKWIKPRARRVHRTNTPQATNSDAPIRAKIPGR